MPVQNHWSIRQVIPCLLVWLTACEVPGSIPLELLDGARKSEDMVRFLAVQRADELSSGNSTLGESGPIGKPGSFRLSARASTTTRATPHFAGVPIEAGGGGPTTLPVEEGRVTSLVLDGALGLWRGFRVGETYFGGINVLGRLALMDGYGETPLDIGSDGNVAFGIGFRTGIIEESARTPGIAISWLSHSLPSISFSPEPVPVIGGGTLSLALRSTDITARQLRIAASKRFGGFGVTAGYGTDNLTGSAALSAAMIGPGTQPAHSWETYMDAERTLLFIGGSYRVGRFTLAGEAGRLSGDTPFLGNDFEGQDDWGRSYFSLGVTVGR